MTNIPRFVTKVIHKFYTNLSDNIVVKGESEFEKVFMRGLVYDFSPRIISEYLNISVPEDFNYEKDYMLDDVALELLGYKTTWPKPNVLRVVDLTFKYKPYTKLLLVIGTPQST